MSVPDWLAALARLPAELQQRELRRTPAPIRRRLFEEWFWQAHDGQEEPTGDWRVWLMIAGRGFGKTRAGAEWVSARARETPGGRIALVGATIDDAVKVMVQGESGLQAVARTGETVRWMPSRGEVHFASGAVGFVYSGERPEALRGPQHHFGWCDEIAKWAHPDRGWDNLMLGLRLGDAPRAVVTTTPKAAAVLRRIEAMAGCRKTGGPTTANVHLPAAFVAMAEGLYRGTRLGRQELDGVIVDEADGALWPRALIEARRRPAFAEPLPDSIARVVIGVDPPGSVGGDACGIVAVGVEGEGEAAIGHVLGDHTVAGLSPEGWAGAVAAAANRWGADRVVAEANQGGDMVASVLCAADRRLPLVLRHAREPKAGRAEPVATLFIRGRAWFAGSFPELEDELAGLAPGRPYAGPSKSPDRADAMVWAMGEAMLGRGGGPRVLPL
jgi:phage terminase large subunit-like protein